MRGLPTTTGKNGPMKGSSAEKKTGALPPGNPSFFNVAESIPAAWRIRPSQGGKSTPAPLWVFHPSPRCLLVLPTGCPRLPPKLNVERCSSCALRTVARAKQHTRTRYSIPLGLMPGRQRFGVSSYGEKRLASPALDAGRSRALRTRDPARGSVHPRARGGRDRTVSACYEISESIACIECCTRGAGHRFPLPARDLRFGPFWRRAALTKRPACLTATPDHHTDG